MVKSFSSMETNLSGSFMRYSLSDCNEKRERTKLINRRLSQLNTSQLQLTLSENYVYFKDSSFILLLLLLLITFIQGSYIYVAGNKPYF